jgi:hypothetical protein
VILVPADGPLKPGLVFSLDSLYWGRQPAH